LGELLISIVVEEGGGIRDIVIVVGIEGNSQIPVIRCAEGGVFDARDIDKPPAVRSIIAHFWRACRVDDSCSISKPG